MLLTLNRGEAMDGKTVKQIRTRLKLTQGKLAKRLGVHRQTIAKWERGTHRVPEMAAMLLRQMAQLSK